MPNLGKLVGRFSKRFALEGGGHVRGFLKEPRSVPTQFDVEFVPRHVLILDGCEELPDGTIVLDGMGGRFFAARFGEGNYGRTIVSQMFAMFQITADVPWHIDSDTIDPVAGLRIVGAPSGIPNLVPVLRQPYRRKNDTLGVETEVYKYLTNAPVQTGQYLESRRIKRCEHNYGLIYAQCL